MTIIAFGRPSFGVGEFAYGKGVLVDPNLLFDDNFEGSSTLLAGRTPLVGPDWQATGPTTLRAGDGEMGQDETSGAGYGVVDLDEVAAIIEAQFSYKSSPLGLMPTIAYATAMTVATARTVHIRIGSETSPGDHDNIYAELGSPSGDGLSHELRQPGWHVKTADFTPPAVGEKWKIRIECESPWVRTILYNEAGAIVAQEVLRDKNLATYLGAGKLYFETFNERLKYHRVTMRKKGGNVFSWPTLNILEETDYDADVEGWLPAPFGSGTVSYVSGAVRIAGSSYPGGGYLPIGPVATGEDIWVSADLLNMSNMDVALVNPGGAVSNIELVAANTFYGRMQVKLTATANEANARLVFLASSLGGSGTLDLDSLLLIKTPPGSP